MADAAVTIIGGGVVGLAIAAEVSRKHAPTFLLERNAKYGMETSSRNSEVIHAGIYYQHGSLKAVLCLEGNHLLYELCEKNQIPHRRICKVITATRNSELEELERLYRLGTGNGVELRMLTAHEVLELEPNITTAGGMFSPNTGIISAHGLMDFYFRTAKEQGAEIQTHCAVAGIERKNGEYELTIEENGQRSAITSERVINAAGLDADTVAGMAGIDIDAAHYRLHWCKGCYFALPSSLSKCVSHLVYPVPTKETLGVHAVLDLGGRLKFGPDMEYLAKREMDYSVDENKRHVFAESVRRILPHVTDDDLTPDMSGLRPKLQQKGEPQKDFIIREESDRGLPGFIDLIGIESPGLTASLAIARMVAKMLA